MKDIENRLRRALKLGGAISSTLVKAALEWVVQAKHMHGIPDDWIISDRSGENISEIAEKYSVVLDQLDAHRANSLQLDAAAKELREKLLEAMPKTDESQLVKVSSGFIIISGYWARGSYFKNAQLVRNIVED